MEDSEKLTALKKAYADIILNTAKEAAARIMVSERKAMRFQQELASSKEEALRMLLRLKQMLDSKVNEAELTSLNQQKKIEELEAQLQEAEEIVRDLRAELREAHAELENVTKHQMHPPVEQNMEGEIAAQENCLQESRLDPYDGSVYSAPNLQFESASISDTGNPTVNGTNDNSTVSVSHDHTNNCYIHNPDFASIVIRRKEPKLYRNGCTQRIHACERSLFDGNTSVSGNLDNVQDETLARVPEEDKAMTVTTNAEADIICEKEKTDELKVVKAVADLVKVPAHRKKRRGRKRKALRSRLHSDHVKETNKESYLSWVKDSPCVTDNNDPSRLNSSMAYENEAQKDLMSPFTKVPTDATAVIEQSGPHSNTEKEEVFLKACSVQNKIKDDKKLLDKSDLTRQESLSTESLEVPACKDVEAAIGSPDKMGPKVSDLDEKVSCRSVNDKFLKYTFRRKRKRESISSDGVDCSLDNISSEKKCGEKQNGHAEPQKSCTMTESSRDSRRLAQVARQVNEAELTSLNQQKKIEELEAQLQEAEEIVRDLRAELREAHAELENVTKHQMHPPVEQNMEGEIAAQENCLQDSRLDPYDGSVYSAPNLQFESASISDTGNPTVNGTNDNSTVSVSHDHTNNCYIHNPDFASIVIRRKEPKLYRNGCTQRIHACERSLFDGNTSVSGNLDNVQDETLARVPEEDKAMTVTTNAEADIICEKEKTDELKVVKAVADLVKVPAHRKKRRGRKRKALRSRLHSDHVKETNKESYLSWVKDSPCVTDNNDPSRVNSSMAYENEAQKDLMSPFTKVPTDATAVIEQSGPHSNTEKEEVFLKACSVQNKIKDDKELLDKSDLTRQESLSTESLEVPACKDVEADKMGPKVSDLDEKVSCRSVNDKFLKYTFRRKRKRESISSDGVDCSLDNISSEKKCGEKQNGHVEPQKSCTMTESSRDSRRLAQVARQLISLSEKKWWH